MKKFKSQNSYRNFAYCSQYNRRYIQDAETKNFLDTLLSTCGNRIENINKGTTLWRAQLGNDTEPMFRDNELIAQAEKPFSEKRMKPKVGQASEGRVNPKGIPCLYLSTERDTALAEVRPWIGSLISIAQFEVIKDLRVVDCSKNTGGGAIKLGVKDSKQIEQIIWSHIDNSFSRPIQENDHKAEYAPTQIIAEYFKENNFDGIMYQSSLGIGKNIALFDIDCAEVKNRFLYSTDKIKFSFSEAANTVNTIRLTLFKLNIS